MYHCENLENDTISHIFQNKSTIAKEIVRLTHGINLALPKNIGERDRTIHPFR